jgi:hypothetical protein
MDNNAQGLASPSAGSNRVSIDPAAGRVDSNGGSIASRYIKRSTVAVIAVAFGIIASDTSFALAGQCADTIKRIEAALDALTSNPDTSAVHQSLRAQMHRQPNPDSVARGQQQAIADERHHRAALERARAADANNDEAGCMKALPDLRHELIIR